jgi:hypothetical protein
VVKDETGSMVNLGTRNELRNSSKGSDEDHTRRDSRMIKPYLKSLLVVAMLMMVAMTGVGCKSKPKMGTYNVRVTPGQDLVATFANAPLQVDVIGVSEIDQPKWAAASVDDYFAGSSDLRNNASAFTRTMNFNASSAGTQTLSLNDPIWNVWRERGVKQMAVFTYSLAMPPTEGRKLLIPLTTDRWNDRQQIDLMIGKSGVDSLSAMKPIAQ